MSKIDWRSKDQVIAYAKSFGKGHTVFWNGTNYQITHTVNEKRLSPTEIIVYRT